MPNYDGTGPLGNGMVGRGLGPCNSDRDADGPVGWSATGGPLRGVGIGRVGIGRRLRGRNRMTASSTTDPTGATSLRAQLAALEKSLGRVAAAVQRLQRQVHGGTED